MDQLITIQLWMAVILLIQKEPLSLTNGLIIVDLCEIAVGVLCYCPKCTNDDLHSIKLVCQQKGQLLEEAEITQNATDVCRSLDDLLVCVAEKVPQCLSTFGSETRRYRWTPWDCHLSQTQIYKYQVMVNNGCRTKDVSIELLSDNKANTVELQSPDTSQTLNETSSSIKTDCKLFVSTGILCLHLIKYWCLQWLP